MIYQFKIKLRGVTKPPVWRRVQVPSHFTFDDLHEVIQAAFGWENEHLYHFADRPYSRNLYISLPNEYDEDDEPTDSRKLTLHDYFGTGHEKISYVYDFGDDWTHDIVLEEAIDETRTFATCTAGKGKCPEEDCGGWWGYEDMKENGDVDDPNDFNLAEANTAVKAVQGTMLHLPRRKEKGPKKIFSKEWMAYMPYKIVSDTDAYYTGIANEVLGILNAHSDEYDKQCMDVDDNSDMAVWLTLWFMDVVSEGGMWSAFTSECKRRYGRYLPFYDFEESDYYPDEVNEVDLRFLLWHYFQTLHDKESVINPESEFLKRLASEIYDVYNRNFETAPTNDSWHEAFTPQSLAEPLFYSFRDYLHKIIDCSFLCILQREKMEMQIEEIEEGSEFAGIRREITHDMISEMLFEENGCFLGLSLAEWGLRMLEKSCPDLVRKLENTETLSTRMFKLASMDNDFLYLQDVANMYDEPDVRYNLKKDSLRGFNKNDCTPGDTYVLCRITRIEGAWYLNGILSKISKENYEKNEGMVGYSKTLCRSDMKRSYANFIKASGGREFMFFKKRKDAVNFYKKIAGEDLDTIAMLGDNTFITATSTLGTVTLIGGARLLKCDDNPCYKEEDARKESFFIMADKAELPYEVACRIYDCGMLADASLNIANGYEYGRNFVGKNAQFFMDYFLNGCRYKLR